MTPSRARSIDSLVLKTTTMRSKISGSVIIPLLLLLYIRYLADMLADNVLMLADDAKLIHSRSDP